MDKSENQRWCMGVRSTPIACIVCERVFYNNVNLLLHFESHLSPENPTPRPHGRDLASLPSRNRFPLTPSPYPYSSAQRITEAQNAVFPRMNNRSRPRPSSVSSAITPNVTTRDANFTQYPVLNSMPPLHPSMVSPHGASSSTRPSMHSQLGTRTFAHSSTAAPRVQLQVENGGQAHFSNHQNHRTVPLGNDVENAIIISSDEEDNNKNAAELDLTLRL